MDLQITITRRSHPFEFTITGTPVFNCTAIDEVNLYTDIHSFFTPLFSLCGFCVQATGRDPTSKCLHFINYCLLLSKQFKRMACTGNGTDAVSLSIVAGVSENNRRNQRTTQESRQYSQSTHLCCHEISSHSSSLLRNMFECNT